jgi:hypothetical protein
MQFLRERWAMDDDGDGLIDEEKIDGIDNDLDGQVDEDTYGNFYSVTTILRI